MMMMLLLLLVAVVVVLRGGGLTLGPAWISTSSASDSDAKGWKLSEGLEGSCLTNRSLFRFHLPLKVNRTTVMYSHWFSWISSRPLTQHLLLLTEVLRPCLAAAPLPSKSHKSQRKLWTPANLRQDLCWICLQYAFSHQVPGRHFVWVMPSGWSDHPKSRRAWKLPPANTWDQWLRDHNDQPVCCCQSPSTCIKSRAVLGSNASKKTNMFFSPRASSMYRF